ncbi:MAG: ATP--guanido phosphotransferase [Planctomycetes bacterium]|nr:ATP--guanido phosphotransferase [Planctomycetota bacterium]
MADAPRDWFSAHATAGNWMASEGPDHDVVVTTRIRLARNVTGFPFRSRLDKARALEVEAHLAERLKSLDLAGDQAYLRLSELSPLDVELLFERHWISKDLARELDGPRGVFFSRSKNVSVMVNEEDHLRLQILGPGRNPEALLDQLREVDRLIGERVAYSYHPRFGYLTSCPTNVGTGLRISVMLHLPALVYSKEIEKVFDAAAKMKLAVRGYHGEGTSYVGDFFQVSNQVTLGKSVDRLLADVAKVLPKLIDWEHDVRRTITKERGKGLEDRVWRAFGVLSNARRITSQEALELLSLLRLGACTGLLQNLPLKVVNELLVLSQPAHVQLLAGKELDDESRDIARADYIRHRLTAPTN